MNFCKTLIGTPHQNARRVFFCSALVAGQALWPHTSNIMMQSSTAEAATIVSKDSVEPGSTVYRKGVPLQLYEGELKVGTSFRPYAELLQLGLKGPAVISVVPSIDTAVCEEQSHLMGESPDLLPSVQRVVISRDTPMAQARFSREAKLGNVVFISDFTQAAFGKKSGLLMNGPELLARAVIVVDAEGVIRHLQVVKEITQLPDMKIAFEVANKVVGDSKQ